LNLPVSFRLIISFWSASLNKFWLSIWEWIHHRFNVSLLETQVGSEFIVCWNVSLMC
jgi:hypothetical protein